MEQKKNTSRSGRKTMDRSPATTSTTTTATTTTTTTTTATTTGPVLTRNTNRRRHRRLILNLILYLILNLIILIIIFITITVIIIIIVIGWQLLVSWLSTSAVTSRENQRCGEVWVLFFLYSPNFSSAYQFLFFFVRFKCERVRKNTQ